MKQFIKLLSIPVFALVLGSCSKDDGYNNTDNTPPGDQAYRAELSGAQETPSNPSTATASFIATYNIYTAKLSYSMTYSGITPTMWHIHKGEAGVNGPVVLELGTVVPSPASGSITLTAAQYDELKNGMYYVNIHSAAYPDGEIRGQIFLNTR